MREGKDQGGLLIMSFIIIIVLMAFIFVLGFLALNHFSEFFGDNYNGHKTSFRRKHRPKKDDFHQFDQ